MNLDSILKTRHHFVDKGPYSQSYGFSCNHVCMWELGHKEDWVLKNWCCWIVVLEKTLESPLDCKEIQPVHSNGFSPKYSLEGLMLKLKLQYCSHLMWRADSLWKTLMLGKIEDRRRRGWPRMSWHNQLNDMGLSKLQEIVKDREAWHAAVRGVAKSWTWLSDWTAKHILGRQGNPILWQTDIAAAPGPQRRNPSHIPVGRLKAWGLERHQGGMVFEERPKKYKEISRQKWDKAFLWKKS